MEKHSNDSYLSKRGLKSPGEVFFYQRWSELLNPYTLDTYQVNILNAHSGIAELQSILQGVDVGTASEDSLDESLRETINLVRACPVLAKKAGRLRTLLLEDLGKMPKARSGRLKIRYTLTRLLKQLRENYFGWVLSDLESAVSASNFPEIDVLVSVLASECANRGWSVKGLYNLRDRLEGPKDFPQRWTEFCTELTGPDTDYECYYLLEKPGQVVTNLDAVKAIGLEVVVGLDVVNRFSDIHGVTTTLGKDSRYIRCSTSARDNYSAVYQTIEEVQNKMDFLAFYELVNPWPPSLPVVTVVDTGRRRAAPIDSRLLFDVPRYPDSTLKVFQLAHNVMTQGLESEQTIKLQGCFRYSTLSTLSMFPQVKFMNLWVSLESLVRTGYHENIIDHIKNTVVPIVGLRYMFRLIRNFAEDCNRCGVTIMKKDGSNLDVNQEPKSPMVKELTAIFLDQTTYSALLAACGRNSLLKYRCEHVKNQISDGRARHRVLTAHCTKLRWHIQRLYRIRNAIAHSAYSKERSMLPIVRNLKDYLDIVVAEIIFELDRKYCKSIGEAVSSLCDQYNILVEVIQDDPLDPHLISYGLPALV